MRMIRLAALGAALTLAAATPALAQQGGQGRGPGRMMEMLFKGIDLDAGQKARVDSIMTKYRAEMPPMTPGTPPDDAARAKRREVMEKETADIRSVLTPDQAKVYDQNLAEMRERMGRRPQH
jgi:Spy/CpxP family protein refolding chaperone